jgi:hypothetical protein
VPVSKTKTKKARKKRERLRPMLLRISEECVRELARQGATREKVAPEGKGKKRKKKLSAYAYREAADLLEAWARMSPEARETLVRAAAPRAPFSLGFDVLEDWATDPAAVADYVRQPPQQSAA